MKRWRLRSNLVLGLAMTVGFLSGCGDSNKVIPLVEVDTPPPLPAQDASKVKAPPGASPSVLPQ